MKIEVEKQWVEKLLELAKETTITTRGDNGLKSEEDINVIVTIERLCGYIESADSFLKEEKE